MQINYLDAISSVLNMMKQPDSACKNIDMHRTCYTTLFKYLMDKGIPFSMDAALDWLEIKNGKFPMRRVLNIEMPCSASSITCSLEISKVLSAAQKTVFLPERNIGILFSPDI